VRRLDPKPNVPSTIRKIHGEAPQQTAILPLQEPERDRKQHEGEGRAQGLANIGPTSARAPAPGSPAVPGPAVALLSPDRYRLQFTVSEETHAKLRHVQALLCREVPSGDPAVIFERALDLLARDLEKKKLAATTAPRAPRESSGGARGIPAHVRRTVWKRDTGQCAFKGKTGRCTERRFLEWHHIQPFRHQGEATVDNISLRCRAHNVFESELVFGHFEVRTDREARRHPAVSGEFAPFRNDGGGDVAVGGSQQEVDLGS